MRTAPPIRAKAEAHYARLDGCQGGRCFVADAYQEAGNKETSKAQHDRIFSGRFDGLGVQSPVDGPLADAELGRDGVHAEAL